MEAKRTPPLPPRAAADAPRTTEERLRDIEALSQRISGYVQFMAQVGSLGGTSAEAKDKAIAAFHERLTVLERQLAHIHEDLRLG